MRDTVIILGAGTIRGVGGALAKRFAAEGRHVIVAGRTLAKVETVAEAIVASGASAEPFKVDTTSEEDLDAVFARAADLGKLDAVIYNAGNNAFIPFDNLTADAFEGFWRVGCYGAFLAAKRALETLREQGEGSLFFTGATASTRGRPNFAHFAAAKAGLRILAQALAREFGPQGVHVAHFLIDGVVDADTSRALVGDHLNKLGDDGVLRPDEIADVYWSVHNQRRSAWTHEMDLRPFSETW